MTLLLSCITEQFAVQASDRRLTYLNGNIVEELANKGTLLCNFATFAYTGLARCAAAEPTDHLLMRALSSPGAKIPTLIENLRVEASKAVRQASMPALTSGERLMVRRTSFVGCGFVGMKNPAAFGRAPTADDLHPFISIVSNAQGLNEEWRPTADKASTAHVAFPDLSNGFFLHVAGQPLSDAERRDLSRTLRRSLRRVVHPESIARILARAIRVVAARNPAVGPNVMCTYVRRSDIGPWDGQISGGPIPLVPGLQHEAAYFRRMTDGPPAKWAYSPADPNALAHYGPNISCDGLQITGIMFGPQPPFTSELGSR